MRSNHRRRSKLIRARRLRPLSSSMHRVVLGAYQLRRLRHRIPRPSVSIHRVVLGAYRPRSGFSTATKRRLNTPCGAGCLSTDANDAILSAKKVSIHRVVLGAYRRQETSYSTVLALTSQYTVWCWVLIDLLHSRARVSSLVVSIHRVVLVLIDGHLYKPRHNAAYSTVVATGDSRTPTRQ